MITVARQEATVEQGREVGFAGLLSRSSTMLPLAARMGDR